jgi:AAA family ATP:ADP antiporter
MKTNKQKTTWRQRFWPVYGAELKKVIPMMLMFYLILFNYTVLRDTKDTLVVTASNSGAEIIPFLKLWVNVPFAIFFTIFYSYMSNYMTRQGLFYLVISIFIGFFFSFTFIIHPYKEQLHLIKLADYLTKHLPVGLAGLIAVIRNWTYTLFYVMSELWGSVCLSLLFWGFANQINTVKESKRFYALFGVIGNLALPSAGLFVYFACKVRENTPVGIDPWQQSLEFMTSVITISGLLIMLIFWWINKHVVYKNISNKEEKKHLSLSIKESFFHIINSKYLICIALIVVSYGVCINMVEVTWKNHLRMQYPSPNDYNKFMGLFSTCTGVLTMFMMLFVTNNLIRRFGWTIAALMTPIVLLVTGACFFTVVLTKDGYIASLFGGMGISYIFLIVLLGALQNILSKSTKYSLFDPTKEMTYIPLDQEAKVKGKAAVDVIGNPTGKSTGSIIQQILIVIFGSLAVSAPYIAAISLIFFVIWIASVKSLGRQFNAINQEDS